MAEGQSFELEGKRPPLSRIKDKLKSKSWAREVAQQFDSSVEQVGEIIESQGIVPVFLDETVKKEISNHWRRHGGNNEVGGYAVGTEGEQQGHKYLHVTKFIPDTGTGTQVEFDFAGGPHGAYDYIRQRRLAGEHLVLIGTVHTHPKGWSGRITGGDRDAKVFATYETESYKGDLLSNKRSHIVMTPADDSKVDIWQAKDTNEPWHKRLARTGHFLLKSNNPPQSRVRVIDKSPRVKVIDRSSTGEQGGVGKQNRIRVID